MDTEFGALSTRELGGLLIKQRVLIDTAEASWLDMLAEFDRRCGFAFDGHRDCVAWLVDKCGMGRSTAKDRLRVAHELGRRPVLHKALAAGKVSYAKVKVLTRILDMGDESDCVFLNKAMGGTVADTERMYQHYKLHRQQEQPPPDISRWDRCGVQTLSRNDGISVMEVRVPHEDEQRILNVLDALIKSEDTGPVEKAPVELYPQPLTWIARRAVALVDLLEAGLAHVQASRPVDPEAATVHVLGDYDVIAEKAKGNAVLDGGIPISGEAARQLACDAGLVRIITRGPSEVLDVGRKTRQWNTPQRRAIRYRWGGRCAFPGCGRRITQIHHCDPWHPGGETNLDCGVPVCRHHHDLVHKGNWTIAYDPNQRAAIFTGPNDQTVIAPTPGALKWAA